MDMFACLLTVCQSQGNYKKVVCDALPQLTTLDGKYDQLRFGISTNLLLIPKICFSIVTLKQCPIAGERVSGLGSELFEMCDELESLLTGWLW